jgi:hypothetical protein
VGREVEKREVEKKEYERRSKNEGRADFKKSAFLGQFLGFCAF